MKVHYNNLNARKLLQELTYNDIIPTLYEHDCINKEEYMAKNIWITFTDDTNMIKVNEIVEKHNPTPIQPQPAQEEILRAKILKDNANTQIQLTQQQKLNADILLKLAKVGGSTNV